MAKDNISDWSATPASNTDIGGISIAGTAAVSNFDDALRELMAQIALSPLDESASAMRGNLDSAQYVATRTAMKAVDTTVETVVYLTEAGREGVFIWRTGDYSAFITADTLEGIYVKANAIAAASGAWVRAGFDDIDPRWFGAAFDGATDDLAALTAADLMARTLMKKLRLPGGAAYISSTWTITCMWVQGAGQLATQIIHANAAQPVILIEPSTSIASDNAYRSYSDFGIITSASSTNALKVLLSDAAEFFSNFRFERMYFGASSSASLLFDNTIGNANGIFSGKIDDCFIQSTGGGINFINGGDSLTVRKCGINGDGIGILASLVSGARQLLITECNLTTLDECVYLSGTVNAQVDSNWMETPSYLGSYGGASGALCYLENCSETRVTRNTIQPLDEAGGGFVGANYAVTIAGTGDHNIVEDNDLSDGQTGHVNITASSVTNTVIGANNRYAEAEVITDAGWGTVGVTETLSLTATWVLYSATYDTLKVRKTDEKTAHLFGAIRAGSSGTSPVTLQVGKRPLVQQLLMYYNPNDGTTGWFSLSTAGVLTHVAGTLTGCFVSKSYECVPA